MISNKFTDKLPWRIQALLGYRPKKVIKNINELDSSKVKRRSFSYPLKKLEAPFHCENTEPKPFSDLKVETLLGKFNGYYCVELKNATYLNVFGYDSFIENQTIIEPLTFRRDKSFVLGNYPDPHPAMTIAKYPSKKVLKGKVLSLSTTAAGLNYGHWTMDFLPKLSYLKECGYDINDFDYILINKISYSFQDQMIKSLDIPLEKIIETDIDDCYFCENLIVPSHDTFSMRGHSFLKNVLAKKINNKVDANSASRIYISRSKAKWARIVNENEIIPLLEKHDFQIIQFEDYSVAEQINLMQNADFIIGVQGSGLINIAYQKEGSKLIEICDKNNIVLTYHIFGIYNSLKRGVIFADSVPNVDLALYDDIKLDPKKFDCLLNKMI